MGPTLEAYMSPLWAAHVGPTWEVPPGFVCVPYELPISGLMGSPHVAHMGPK